MHSSVSVCRMEALYFHRVKRTEVCLLHFRREDSGNYLNGRIPEKWFCFKFGLSILLPRKGKHSREWVNPPSWLSNPLELSSIRDTSVHEMFTTRPNVSQSWQPLKHCLKLNILEKRLIYNFFLVFHIVYFFAFYCKVKIVNR